MTQKSGKLKGKKAEPLTAELEFIYRLIGKGATDEEILEEMQDEEFLPLRKAGSIKRRRREYNAAKKVFEEKGELGVQAAEGLPAGKYLIDHYQKLHKVLERFYDQFRTPKLSKLSLFTLEDRVTISHSYVSGMDTPAIIYDKGTVKLDVEVSDPFLWERLEKHLTVEFPEFSENLGDWKRCTASIVEECHDITKTIADQLAKKSWDSAEPDLDPASKGYGPGVFYHRLTELMYKCVINDHSPHFEPISGSHSLVFIVMEYPGGSKAVAQGQSLFDQVEQCCLGIVSDGTIKEKVEQVLDLAKQAEITLKPTKQNLRKVLERGTFKGTCSVCADLVSQGS